MPYCTQTDILGQLPETDLIALTDDTGLGEVDTSTVDQAIADADSTIDAYCQGRYPLPLEPVPSIIRRLSVDLAIYNLHSRRAVDEVPKVRESRKADALRFLEKVAAGGILLGAATPEPTASTQAAVASSPARIFSRDTLVGY